MERTYITHVTRDYLDVSVNLAKSIRKFSKIPLIVYCVNLESEDHEKFKNIEDVYLRNIEFELEEKNTDDHLSTNSGNFYVNRGSLRIYKVLYIKTIAMQMAIEEGFSEVCYLDSDCIATPIVDEIFDWSNEITNYPLATEGIHQYVMIRENGIEIGNPFSGGSWSIPDNKLALEWPLMNFLGIPENQRGTYRTTNVLLMNSNCLEFIKTWKELCFILPKLVDVRKWAAFHEETIYNVLNWRETNKGLPLCYVNLSDGIETVNHLYSDMAVEGNLRWDESDTSRNFYKIPDDKKYVKVLHGEKRTSEVDKIIDFFIKKDIVIDNVLIQVDTFIKDEKSIELTTECIKRLKSLNLPILLTSHLPIPDELKNMVDFYEEDLNNILLPSDGRLSKITFNSGLLSSEIILENSDSHAPACLTSIINGAKFAKGKKFKYFIRFEYDVVPKIDYIESLKSIIYNGSKKRGFVFGSNDWIDGKIIMLNSSEYLEAFNKDILTSDDYISFIRENGVPFKMERHLQNVQHFILKAKNLLDGVNFMPTLLVEDFIDNDFVDARVNPGIFRPVYLNDSSFATICHGWNKGEISVCIYLNDSLISEHSQFFYKSSLTYLIFDFIPNNNYKIIINNKQILKEETFEFSTINELKKMGFLQFKN